MAKIVAPEAEIKIIGIRPGEKLHESMISKHESYNTIECEDKYIILPSTVENKYTKNKYIQKYGNNFCQTGFSYSSEENKIIDDDKLLDMINNYKNYVL